MHHYTSDALFHQFGVRLAGVLDLQLADVGIRRARGEAVAQLPSMARCASRHLDAPSTRVAEELKTRVKGLYAGAGGGDSQLWALRPFAEDVRRYAALDAWILLQLHAVRRCRLNTSA